MSRSYEVSRYVTGTVYVQRRLVPCELGPVLSDYHLAGNQTPHGVRKLPGNFIWPPHNLVFSLYRKVTPEVSSAYCQSNTAIFCTFCTSNPALLLSYYTSIPEVFSIYCTPSLEVCSTHCHKRLPIICPSDFSNTTYLTIRCAHLTFQIQLILPLYNVPQSLCTHYYRPNLAMFSP